MGQATLGAARRWTSLPAALLGILAIALAVACGEGDVTPPPPPPPPGAATVTVTPNDFGVLSLGTVQLTAEVLDNNGNPVSGATVTWSSDAAAVASVDANGLVTASNAGVSTSCSLPIHYRHGSIVRIRRRLPISQSKKYMRCHVLCVCRTRSYS